MIFFKKNERTKQRNSNSRSVGKHTQENFDDFVDEARRILLRFKSDNNEKKTKNKKQIEIVLIFSLIFKRTKQRKFKWSVGKHTCVA